MSSSAERMRKRDRPALKYWPRLRRMGRPRADHQSRHFALASRYTCAGWRGHHRQSLVACPRTLLPAVSSVSSEPPSTSPCWGIGRWRSRR
jgi:hypothetical protein